MTQVKPPGKPAQFSRPCELYQPSLKREAGTNGYVQYKKRPHPAGSALFVMAEREGFETSQDNLDAVPGP